MCPSASQLVIVWDISAWLTSELSVRGACLCPDLVTELLRMEGTRGGGVLVRPSVAETINLDFIPFSLRLLRHTRSHKKTLTNGQTHLVSASLTHHNFSQLQFDWMSCQPDKSLACYCFLGVHVNRLERPHQAHGRAPGFNDGFCNHVLHRHVMHCMPKNTYPIKPTL